MIEMNAIKKLASSQLTKDAFYIFFQHWCFETKRYIKTVNKSVNGAVGRYFRYLDNNSFDSAKHKINPLGLAALACAEEASLLTLKQNNNGIALQVAWWMESAAISYNNAIATQMLGYQKTSDNYIQIAKKSQRAARALLQQEKETLNNEIPKERLLALEYHIPPIFFIHNHKTAIKHRLQAQESRKNAGEEEDKRMKELLNQLAEHYETAAEYRDEAAAEWHQARQEEVKSFQEERFFNLKKKDFYKRARILGDSQGICNELEEALKNFLSAITQHQETIIQQREKDPKILFFLSEASRYFQNAGTYGAIAAAAWKNGNMKQYYAYTTFHYRGYYSSTQGSEEYYIYHGASFEAKGAAQNIIAAIQETTFAEEASARDSQEVKALFAQSAECYQEAACYRSQIIKELENGHVSKAKKMMDHHYYYDITDEYGRDIHKKQDHEGVAALLEHAAASFHHAAEFLERGDIHRANRSLEVARRYQDRINELRLSCVIM